MKHRSMFAMLCALSLLCGCSNPTRHARPASVADYATVEQAVPGCAASELAFDCDRRAILSMLGEYQVSFSFTETAVLQPGYSRKPEKRSGGFETVVLVEDRGTRISLQHILVGEGGWVVKHWRQDWVHESGAHWNFTGAQRFESRADDPATIVGTWTQMVYEVDDAPRYAGTGRWNHKYGVSTWTSNRSWRPLPRREYTSRSDYQLINAQNRHTITPHGWTHEQDNSKVIRTEEGEEKPLVREFGFNEYRRIAGHDFSPGLAYWRDTAEFWRHVRERWEQEFARTGGLTLVFPTDDEALINQILALADAYRRDPRIQARQADLDAAFATYVRATPADPVSVR